MATESAADSVRRTKQVHGIQFVTVRYEAGTERVRSSCPDGQFWLMLRGSWRTRVLARNERDCEAFSLSYHVPGEKNRRLVARSGAALFGIRIPHLLLDSELLPSCPTEPLLQEKGPACLSALRLFRAFSQEDSATSVLLEELLAELIVTAAGKRLPTSRSGERTRVERAHEILHARQSESLTLKEIADAAGLHPVYLTAAFRQRFGCTVGDYLRRLRLETALGQLLKTDAPLIEIAHAAGFYDQAHFNRIFKEHLGIAPGALRDLTGSV